MKRKMASASTGTAPPAGPEVQLYILYILLLLALACSDVPGASEIHQ